MNEFYEETAEVLDLTKARKKRTVYTFISICSLIFAAISLYILPMPLKQVDGETVIDVSEPLFWVCLFIAALMVGVFLTLFFVFYNKRNKTLVEYDYIFFEDKILVNKVFNRNSRKFAKRIFINNIYKLGKVGSNSFNSISEKQDVKVYNFTSNKKPLDGKTFYYLAVKDADGHNLYSFECTEQFIIHILKSTGKAVVEEDFK